MGYGGGGGGIAKAAPAAAGGPAATAASTAGKLPGQGERLLGTTAREMVAGPHRPVNPASVEDLLDTATAVTLGAGAAGTAYGLAALVGERLTGSPNAEVDPRSARTVLQQLDAKAKNVSLTMEEEAARQALRRRFEDKGK